MNLGQVDQATRQSRRYGVRRLLLALLLILVLSLTGILGVSGYVGWNLTHPLRQVLDDTPLSVGMSYQDISFKSRVDGLAMKGWLIRAPGGTDTVIFAHGYRRNRLSNDVPILPIAQEMVAQGFNVLMFDFRNSGESEGNLTSVGQYEVRDLLGAVDYIQSQPDLNRKIILYGFSMGAATAIIAAGQEPCVTAVIADSPFADFKTYLNENLSVWSELPSFPFNQAFFIIVPPLTGLQPETVSPIKDIPKLGGRPLLLIHGEADTDIPIENSAMLQKAYPEGQLLSVPGGTHVKNFKTAPELYLKTVKDFMRQVRLQAKP